MLPKTLVTLIALCLLSLPTFGKERDWKTGKVRDTDSESYVTTGGSTTQGRVNPDGTYTAGTTQAKWKHRKYTFVVEGDEYTYVASHTLSFRWSKEIQLTVNGPVKYAVEKSKLYLIDEQGREFKLKIEKKILKEP